LTSVPALQKMGCEIEVFAACLGRPACRFHDGNAMHSAVIRGVSKLRGAEVELPDVRAGFSAVLAASVADRPSTLHGVRHIERGYHHPPLNVPGAVGAYTAGQCLRAEGAT
jgi:UDP-N-acetylglucosamine 1-carboxyvinyltransferase